MARSNDAAGQMLQEFADLLAISGSDPFRVRSYEKASRSVAGYHAEIANLDAKGLVAILGHRPPVDVDLDAVFAAAARTGTAVEINSFPDRLDLDAQAVPHLDYLRFGVATAQRGWATKADVVNAYPLAKLRRFLQEKEARCRILSQ